MGVYDINRESAFPNGHAQYERCSNYSMAEKRYYYYTYGLLISSQLKLPELLPAQEGACPDDVEILTCELSEELEEGSGDQSAVQIINDRCQFVIKGVARYRIEHGRRILVDCCSTQDPGARVAAGDVRLFLLGTALGILLHQRRWLPLHISALNTPSGVWAFTGPSGAGKSTLAAWLHARQGWPLVSDDVAVIKPEDAVPYLYPGPPRLKLWKDALAALGINQHGLIRDQTRADKYHLALHQTFQNQPQPLRALVILECAQDGETPSLLPIKGVEAFKAIMATLYRAEIGKAFNVPEQLLHNGARLADQINVYRYRRPWSLGEMDTNLAPLLQNFKS